jgi:hypothetical protein
MGVRERVAGVVQAGVSERTCGAYGRMGVSERACGPMGVGERACGPSSNGCERASVWSGGGGATYASARATS